MKYFPDVCHYCVAPKRHLNCHANCKEYLDAKAAHDELMRKVRKEQCAQRDADLAAFRLRRN